MGLPIFRWLILLSVIQLGGGHCTKKSLVIYQTFSIPKKNLFEKFILIRIFWGFLRDERITVKPELKTTSNGDHLPTATIVLVRFQFLLHKAPLNNNYLPTTDTIFGSQRWSLNTNPFTKYNFWVYTTTTIKKPLRTFFRWLFWFRLRRDYNSQWTKWLAKR